MKNFVNNKQRFSLRKSTIAVLNQLILALACVSLGTPVFANEQVGTEELFGTVAVQETKEEKGYHIVDSATGQALIQDPTTGQPYTLEKLLALGLYRADGRSDIFEPNTGRVLPIDPETGAPYTIEKLEMLGVVNGRGGASLVNKETDEVYANVSNTSKKLLEDYSFYVGKWRNDEKFLAIDETGKVAEGGQIGYDANGNVIISYSVGGFIVMAIPAGSTYPHDASIGDTTKDRLYLIHDYPYPIVLYREADYLAMTSGASEVVKESNSTDNQVVSGTSEDVKESQTVSASADSQDISETVPTSKTTQSTKAKNTSRPLPNTGEKTGLLMSVLGGLILTLGVIGVVIRRKKSY